MKENIETKDVQRTEYLDKNGLDMLWAKVKENTHNQVEEECNRAQAVEGDITNKLDNLKYVPYVSKTNMNSTELGDFVKYQLGATQFIISAQHGSNDARTEFGFGEVGFVSVSKDSAAIINYEGVTVGGDNKIKLTNTGIRKYINSHDLAGSATEAFSTNGGVIDTTAFALKSELDSYAKKTDIPAVNTSDFVSKTATDAQIINSTLGIIGGGIQIIDYIADSDPVSLELASSGLTFDGCDRSTITLNASDVNSSNGSRIIIEAHNENPQIVLQSNVGSDFAFHDNLTITNEGISNSDDNANHVFATDGSIADLTQYAKKSELPTAATKENFGVVKVGDGLNVTDGTISVNSTAIGAGNYIPYAKYERGQYIMLNSIRVEEGGNKNALNSCIGLNGLSVYNRQNNGIHSNIQCAEIELQSDKNRVRINDDGIDIWKLDVHAEFGISDYLLGLSKRGIRLYHGDDNHVLTSNASTIDITQYVLKSVYDEKITALEARIAALEAKYAETA